MNDKNKPVFLALKLFIGVLIIAGVWWLVKCGCLSLKNLSPQALRDYIRQFGILSPLVYILAYALNTVSILPPIAGLSLAAGLAFGSAWGAVYLMSGAMLGTCATFFIGRYFGRVLVQKWIKGKFKALDEKLGSNGFMTVLFFRVIPLVPYEVLNYAGGLSGIKFKDYFFATFLGLLPGVIVSSLFGGSLGQIHGVKDIFSPKFLFTAGLMALIIAVPFVYRKFRKGGD
ncbi:MAG: TVP38/TMEM64 family protein [Candidatus Omnitrophica bacterium]|nr:TVP38/TMEM64 family protein [Candidatus Omnitrophota bacterium]